MKRSLCYAPLQHACQNMWSVRNLLYYYIIVPIHTSCFLNNKLLQHRTRMGQKNTTSSYYFLHIYYTEHAQPRLLDPMYPHWLYGIGNGLHASRCFIVVVSIITITNISQYIVCTTQASESFIPKCIRCNSKNP